MANEYFSGIKVGDTVYDRDGKEWKVKAIGEISFRADHKEIPSVAILFDGHLRGWSSIGQQFFWQPPSKLEPPPRPKRMVQRKEVLESVIWFLDESGLVFPGFTNPPHKPWSSFVGKPPMTVTLEWEEEE